MIQEIVLRVRDRGPTPLHGNDALGLVGCDREQADAAVEVGEHAVGSRRLPHEPYERFGAVGPALEEGVDRHPQRVAFDHLVHMRRLAAHHVGREIEDRLRGVGECGPFAAPDADAQGHLGRSTEVAVAQQLVDQRVGHETRVDQHRVVGLMAAEGGLAVDDERAHGRAKSFGGKEYRLGERRVLDVRDAVEGVAKYVELQLRLRLGCDVLPSASAATLTGVNARGNDASRGRFEHLDDAAAEVIGPIGRDLDAYPLSGKGPVDERDSAVLYPAEGVAAGNHARRRQLHWSSQSRTLRDSRIVKALRVNELGEPEQVMVLEDRPEPVVRPGDVRIRVHAAALNFPDVLLCRGEYQVKPPVPFTPGAEVAGVIDELGDGVEGLAVGDRVLAIPNFGGGGFAESTTASAAGVFRIPDSMPFAAGAVLHVVYQTGHLALHRRAHIQPGETLLVHAGAGGVGSAAIQLGLAAGARVIATAGGADKVEVCRKLGAELALDYKETDFVDAVKDFTDGRGADVIYDPVGGDTYDRSTKCIAFEGRILIIGFTGGRFAEARTNHVLIKNYSVVGVHWALYATSNPQLVRETHAELVRLFEAGEIDPLISERVTLAEVPAALARLGSRGTHGKIVCEL